jgi:hypothetical protein
LALRDFCKSAGLPKPSFVVDSGNGLHCYWHFEEFIEKDRWLLLAKSLKDLTGARELKADPTRTADIASALRVPGTKNWKDRANPKLVIIEGAETGRDFDRFAAALLRPKPEPRSVDNPGGGDHPCSSARSIISKCPTLAHVTATGGAVSEPLWRGMIGLVKHTTEGEPHPAARAFDGREYALTLEALGGRAPIVVVPPSDDLDRASDHLPVDGRRRSAASALQDWLNASADVLWGLCCNGERLRLVRGNASLTRPAYIEADLRQIFEADGFADFAALWLLIHATRFGPPGSPAGDCALERWRESGGKEGLVVRERLRDGVEAALLAFGSGFLSENPALRERVQGGELPLTEYFEQLLRLVYRLIFLLVVEERGLLHAPDATGTARRLYVEGYSLSSLRERAVWRTAWDRHHDHWEGLLVVFAALAQGEPRLGLPALGGLFQAELMPDLEQARLPNRALMLAVYRLAWMKDGAALVSINWRDMKTEELGAVYESLLELTPRNISPREIRPGSGDRARSISASVVEACRRRPHSPRLRGPFSPSQRTASRKLPKRRSVLWQRRLIRHAGTGKSLPTFISRPFLY